MGTTTRSFCDLCDKSLYRSAGVWYSYFRPRVKNIVFSSMGPCSWRSSRIDVCDDCWQKFRIWLKDAKKVEE